MCHQQSITAWSQGLGPGITPLWSTGASMREQCWKSLLKRTLIVVAWAPDVQCLRCSTSEDLTETIGGVCHHGQTGLSGGKCVVVVAVTTVTGGKWELQVYHCPELGPGTRHYSGVEL